MATQLLVAAALVEQHREVISGDDQVMTEQDRDEADMGAADAIARAFRDWTNGEKLNARHSSTSGSEDSSSWSSDVDGSSLADDDGDDVESVGGNSIGNSMAHGMAFQGISSKFRPEDHNGGNITDFVDLDLKDVSRAIKAKAHALLGNATSTSKSLGDWADKLANDILDGLSGWLPPTSTKKKGGKGKGGNRGQSRDQVRFDDSIDINNLPKEVKIALDFLKLLRQQAANEGTGTMGTMGQYITRSSRQRQPSTLADPDPDVYDPSRWRRNLTDYNDGIWVRKVAEKSGLKEPAFEMETGWITWEEQEKMFPSLGSRLKLQDVRGPHPNIFKAETVDKYVWDPLDRMINEPKNGPRQPLHLGPITMHSLARWRQHEFGFHHPLNPLQFPKRPDTVDKRLPLPSTTLARPNTAAKNTSTSPRSASRESYSSLKWATFPSSVSSAAPSKEIHSQLASQNTPVASVWYPLNSPSATSISMAISPKAKTAENHGGARQGSANATTPATAKSDTASPLTPRWRGGTAPVTPTVVLYKRPYVESVDSPLFAVLDPVGVGKTVEELYSSSTTDTSIQEAERSPSSAYGTPVAYAAFAVGPVKNKNKNKRTSKPSSFPAKKRRTGSTVEESSSSSDFGEESDGDVSDEAELLLHAPSPLRTYTAASATAKWVEEEMEEEGNGSGGVVDSDNGSRNDSTTSTTSTSTSISISTSTSTSSQGDQDTESDVQVEPLSPVPVSLSSTTMPHTSEMRLYQARVSDAESSSLSSMHGSHSSGDGQLYSATKSVRFDLDTPSEVMRREARRAVDRLELTSQRQGPLGPYR
ncbi:hypothetical protein GGR50DRAFT_267011 [Xylaria sp. CBS 124048]|nr:hypothetical protein GGR50DRAFT_267011 [Xylaria sp. CBS 124048]